MSTDRASDVEYWGLTTREQVDYFGRVSGYWGRKVREHGDRADRFGRRAARLRWVLLVLVVLALGLLVAGQVMSG